MNNCILWTAISGFSLVTIFGFTTQEANAAKLVVGHDVNTLGSFVASSQEETFAVNLASFLTADSPGKNLLLYESNPGDGSRNFSTGVLGALTNAGFSVTVTPDYNTSFLDFDAIFIAQDFPTTSFLDDSKLISFVEAGGGVYLAGGVGGSVAIEAAGWNTFLNNYGLAFESSSYNGINNVMITSTNPIFAGITSLRSGNGQSIISLGTNPDAKIVQFVGNQGVYAVVDAPLESIPEPTPILSLLAFVGMSLTLRRNWQS